MDAPISAPVFAPIKAPDGCAAHVAGGRGAEDRARGGAPTGALAGGRVTGSERERNKKSNGRRSSKIVLLHDVLIK